MVLNKKINVFSAGKNQLRIGDLLQLCNFGVCGLIILAFFSTELKNSLYINDISLALTLILCMQTYIALKIENKRPSPFILIIAFVLIFFYELRIFTLLMFPDVNILNRFYYASEDTNFAIIYIIIFNVFLYLGLFSGKKIKLSSQICSFSEKKFRFGISFFLVSLIILLAEPFYNPYIPSILGALILSIFSIQNIWMVLTIYCAVNWEIISKKNCYILVFMGFLIIIMQTLGYSRSAILTIFNIIFLILLTINLNIKINFKYLLRLIYLVPILITLLFSIYALSTTSRSFMGEYSSPNTITQKIEIAIESIKLSTLDDYFLKNDQDSSGLKKILTKALSRAGFFDFSAELIAHKKEYEKVFSFDAYIKSFIDNLLTPGFNIYDQPRISSTLKYYYGGLMGYTPTISTEFSGYHTDQFGIYGELFSLFDWFSLPIAFIIAVLFKAAYSVNLEIGYIPNILYKYSILFTFLLFINSFGLDWVVWDFFSTFFSLLVIYFIIFKINILPLNIK